MFGFPFQDMGIEDPEFVDMMSQIEELEKKLFAHPLHKVLQNTNDNPFFFPS